MKQSERCTTGKETSPKGTFVFIIGIELFANVLTNNGTDGDLDVLGKSIAR